MNKPATQLTLTCQAECLRDRVRLSYAVTSRRPEEVYILDLLPAALLGDVKTRALVPDFSRAELRPAGPAAAHLLFGIPPLPKDRLVNVRLFPLATKLEPGKTLERVVEFSRPLREYSPYDAGNGTHRFETVWIKSLQVTVHVLSSAAEGIEVEPAAAWPGFVAVRAPRILQQIEELHCQVEVPSVEFLRRKDMASQ
ncbi:hypothetical protein AYO44_02600 [Planctomycetaceae bacterium SCGC AG-212-F19]|nr:hypothetical protein AYO44_02600 [Planctomycetaceae bacterium SCGC AG-212-F19]